MVATTNLVVLLIISGSAAFQQARPLSFRRHAPPCASRTCLSSSTDKTDASFAVKSSELDADLSDEERTTINVFRTCGPSVAFVTSVMNRREQADRRRSGRFGGRDGGEKGGREETDEERRRRFRGDNVKPEGLSLGSGSGFVVASDGYLVTNYHVVQRAHQMNTAVRRYNDQVDGFVSNATKSLFGPLGDNPLVGALANRTKANLRYDEDDADRPRASVYVRINSSSKYRECRVVDVRPDLDVAVLKVVPRNVTRSNAAVGEDEDKSYAPIPYGSSSNLLVGQRLIAIGNPFGLDQTVTSGVVSALNREVQSVGANLIRGCIQTDAAINPGNSGGPLLDGKGRLVGVNTAIITTSGSNAGIGFAIPVDKVKAATEEIIARDRAESHPDRPAPGSLGADLAGPELTAILSKKFFPGKEGDEVGLFVAKVKEGSPAEGAGLRPLVLNPTGGVSLGDRIIAVGGKTIRTREDLEEDMRSRVEGEQVAITVEDKSGERRVLYVTLARKEY